MANKIHFSTANSNCINRDQSGQISGQFSKKDSCLYKKKLARPIL